jgi:uncharacterized protein (DUF3820 family)
MLQFTERELKLIRLMLDSAAAQGEVANASRMLVEALRARAVSAQDIEESLNKAAVPEYGHWAPDYGLCTMPWGKHKGHQFKDIPPSYFRYVKSWIEDPQGDRLPRMAALLSDIKAWLAQA